MAAANKTTAPTRLPTGVVTLLFSDLVGSTRGWETYGNAYGAAVQRHFDLLRQAVRDAGGHVFKTVGDQVCAAFRRPEDAVGAAIVAQSAISLEPWEPPVGSLSVRMAIHTGEPVCRGGDYFGPAVNRVARLTNAAHGGQILLSVATRNAVGPMAGVETVSLGVHMLKDLLTPEAIFQVTAPGLPSEFPPPRTLDARPHNLPVQLTSFVDRVEAVASLAARLSEESVRLVTLLGPPGVGKTRLATQFAAEYAYRYTDGAWLVELAPVRHADAVAARITDALGVPPQEGTAPSERLLRHLQDRQALLVLDNFEHVMGAAPLVSDILTSARQVRLLVTSRSLLRVQGETCVDVSPLDAPEGSFGQEVANLAACPSTALFLDRALSAKAGWQPDVTEERQVAELCRRLDGLPLAIEFAAARVRSLTIGEIQARLSHRFRLLGGTRSDLPEHQRTLRAAFDWSYDLLTPEEQRALAQLGVFQGGFTLDAAEAVCTDIDAWETVPSLQDHSFVYARQLDGVMRYGLLEAVREYALERLGDDAACLCARHAAHYLPLAERAAAAKDTDAETDAFAAIDTDLDNIRAAMAWSCAAGRAETAARFGVAMEEYLRRRGLWAERLERLDTALALARRDLSGATVTAWLQFHAALALKDLRRTGDAEAGARDALSRSVALADPRLEARCANLLGVLAGQEKRWDEASSWHERSLNLAREHRDGFMEASALTGLGRVSAERGCRSTAARYYESSIAVWRRVGSRRGLATTLNGLGVIAEEDGRREEAILLYREALELQLRLMNVPSVALLLNNIAEALERDGRPIEALGLFRHAETLFRQSGSPNAAYVAGMRERLESDLPAADVQRITREAAGLDPLQAAWDVADHGCASAEA